MQKKTPRIFIAHGYKGSPQKPPWLMWLKEKLENKGFEVIAPQFPNPENPKVSEWVKTIDESLGGVFENVIFLGHSLGGCAILRYLDAVKPEGKTKIPQNAKSAKTVILVAVPYSADNVPAAFPKDGLDFIVPPYNFEKIRREARQFIYIYSDDDPLVKKEAGLEFRRRLGGKFTPMKGMRHFETQDEIPKIKYIIENLFHA